MDFFTFFVLVCLVGLVVYTWKIESRRLQDSERFTETASALTSRIHALEQQIKALLAGQAVALTEKPETTTPATIPPTARRESAQAPKPVTPPPAPQPARPPQTPPPPRVTPPPAPAPPVAHPAPAAAAQGDSAALAAKVAAALAQKAAAAGASPTVPAGQTTSVPQASARHAAQPPMPGMIARPTAPAAPPSPANVPFGSEMFASRRAAAVPKIKRKLTLEEIGTKWLPKVGITILVIGVALYTASKWALFPPYARILLFYVLGAALLALGIFFERKEQYKLLGRVLIGGGWALTFFTTYAMRHVEASRVLGSDVLDLFLMLAVAAVMVWHTLRYNSQLVTGFAFLLGFAAVSVSHETAFSMSAGAILAVGLTVLVVRRQWYELEVFGILASYSNHFYWLYLTFLRQGHQQSFDDYPASIGLMAGYWVIFRTSYLIRKISDKKQERVSTWAGLLNPLLFLGVMKYQSFHPEWAFYALLAMGAIEFTLGQLPVSRTRQAPFQILSSLGATLMVVAVPFKYAGSHSLELLWMAGAEAFLLAGVFTRERLFRHFGGIISLLVAGYLFAWPPNGVIFQAGWIVNGDAHHNPTLSLVLALVAALFYVNSHIVTRLWRELFDWEVEQQAVTVFSFVASIFAVCAVYTSTDKTAVAVILAVLMTALAWIGKQFRISQLLYQAHWIAIVAIVDASFNAIHLDSSWHAIPLRVVTLSLVAALLYLSSNFVRMQWQSEEQVFLVLYRWAGSGLLAGLIWLQISLSRPLWLIAVLWTALGLALAGIGHLLKRNEFKWQGFVLAMMSFVAALALNFGAEQEFHRLTYRLISVTLVAGGIYLLARWTPLVQIRPLYSWAGTILFGYLAYCETQATYQLWTAVLWIAMAALLAMAARFLKDRALLWQTHLMAAVAAAWTIYVSFLGKVEYHGTREQLFTVLITSAALYGLTWLTKIEQLVESNRIWQAYSWAGSLLLTWLAWYQVQPISVSLAWGGFALIMFEIGYNVKSSYLRLQAYVAVACSFAHLFYANINTPLPGGPLDPHILLIVLLAPIYFWIYWRLREKGDGLSGIENKLHISYLVPYFGTATLASLVRFEIPAENVVIGYAVIVLAAMVVAWQMRLQVFLHQALIMLGFTAFRICFHNFRNLQGSLVSTLPSSIWAIAIVAVALPVAFQLRTTSDEDSGGRRWIQFLLRRPEQAVFFVAVGLTAALLYIRMSGMVLSLDWCLEGVLVVLGAFFAREKAFVWTGLVLLLLSAGKICVDLYHVDSSVKYLAMAGVGGILLVAGYLFAKNRDALREYL